MSLKFDEMIAEDYHIYDTEIDSVLNFGAKTCKSLIKIDYLSLVNILMDKLVVKELIQSELNKENLIFELNNIIKEKESIAKDYDKLINLLDKKGASKNAAQFIIETI